MREPWTGDLVGRMHNADITNQDLAAVLGWSKAYVSMLLNGHRTTKGAKEKLNQAFDIAVANKNGGHDAKTETAL